MERVGNSVLSRVFSLTVIVLASFLLAVNASAQGDPKANVNLIGMTPDPADIPDSKYRQQNEPACAIRPGDSACIICAYNDYRAVDELGDAWEGVSQSCDAGNTWRSRLAPGHALHPAPIAAEFAADPRLAALPGMTIFNFIAGYRDSNVGVLAIQHWLEVNKEDADHYEPGLRTFIADEGSEGRFLDKPDMLAVLDPPTRQGKIEITTEMENPDLCEAGAPCYITREYPTGTLYLAYAAFTGSNSIKVMLKTSSDWGQTWRNQSYKLSEDQNEVSGISLTALDDNKVLAVWRRRGDNNNTDAIMYSLISNGGKKATKGEVLAEICAFDQPTLTGTELQDVLGDNAYFVTFRTNDFPWTANDGENFYVFFSERQRDPVTNECVFNSPARVVMKHSSDGLNWEGLGLDNTPIPLDPEPVDEAGDDKPGSFQFMPTAFGADGKVQVAWYDTRREFCSGVLPWVADYDGGTWGTSCGQQGFFQRTVDVYTTTIEAGKPVPPPVRASQFSIVVDGENRYESEASFANKKMFSQGQAPFLGDYIAMAGREFRQNKDGEWPTDSTVKWISNATANPNSNEDFFVAWTDNRDVRGSIQSVQETLPYNPPATNSGVVAGNATIESLLDENLDPEMLASNREVSRTGPPRDTTKTAEGLAGADPGAFECTPGADNFERSRDSNIYGSLIKDEVRLYATTPVKPLGGLQRAFVVALSNSSLESKKYDLAIPEPNCITAGCTSSFRQKDPFVWSETVEIPAKSTLARTVFVTGSQRPIKVTATDFFTGDLIASIQLANAPEMSDPENCDGTETCSVDLNELHNLVLQTANAAGLLNAGLLNAELLNSPLTAMAIDAGACEDPATVGCVIEYGSTLDPNEVNAGLLNAELLNEALEAAGLLNAGLLNAGLLNAGLLNAGLLNTALSDDPDDPYYDLNEIPNPVDSDGNACTSVGCVILYAAGTGNDTYLGYVNAGLLNAGLLNETLAAAGLLNAGLLNAGLLNAGLLNAGLLNAGLLNATLLNAGLLNPTVEAAGLLNAGLLNAELLNAGLLNPTLAALAVEGGCCDHEAEPTAGSMIIFAVENPDIINASLLNATLLNAGLLNAGLLNAGLLNAELLNAGLLNAELLNAELLNAGLLNADLLNADLLNAGLLNSTMVDDLGNTEVTYDDYTYPITNTGNVTTAIDADITINAPLNADGDPDYIGAKLMTWSANATPTIIDCTEYVEVDTRIQTITDPDANLQIADINNPFKGQTTVIANPGETVFVTLRVIGTPDQLKNVRVSGFTASSQAANCGVDYAENPDGCSEFLNDEVQIVFADLAPPIITVPADITVEATSVDGAIVDYTVTVYDSNDANPQWGCEPESGSTFGIGTTPVSCNASDAAGNVSDTATFYVTVQDTTNPTITAPAAVTVEANGNPNSSYACSAFGTPSGSDLFGVTFDCAPTSLSLGANTVTWTATDGNGNTATANQTVTVADATPPTITAPAAITLEANGNPNSSYACSAFGSPSGSDLFGVTFDCAPTSLGLGANTVTWTATDGNGNTATADQMVTVEDKTSPTITAPAAITLEANGNPSSYACSAFGSPSGSDLFGVTFDCAPTSLGLGANTVTWTATDGNGNKATASQSVTVTDSTPPAITAPAAITLEANGNPTSSYSCSDYGTPVVSDYFGATYGCSPTSGLSLGDNTVTWTATDGNGLTTTAYQTVTIVDTTNPDIDPIIPTTGFDPEAPYPYELSATSNTITVSWPVSVTDTDPYLEIACSIDGQSVPLDSNYDPNPFIDANGKVVAKFLYDFGPGETTVTCTATDSQDPANGGTDSFEFTVIVYDTTPPVITVPTGDGNPVYIRLPDENGSFEYDYSGLVSVSDNADADPTLECRTDPDDAWSSNFIDQFDYGETTVYCRAIDDGPKDADGASNESTAQFKIVARWLYDVEVILAKKVAKAGSTIPIDWVYKDWDTGLPIDSSGFPLIEGRDSPVSLSYRKATEATCATLDPTGTGGEDSGSSDFRYSSADGIWQYSWQTPSEKGYYRITITPPGAAIADATACVSLK